MTDPLCIAATLWLLASMDAGFAGFRDAAGRSPRLHKHRLVLRRVGMGLVFGQLVCALMLVLLAAWVWLSPTPQATLTALSVVGARMATVFGVYAALVLSALGIYAVPHPDVSSLATVLVLGPFTLGRPAIVAGGVAWASWGASPEVVAAAVLSGLLVLAVGPALGRHWHAVSVLDAHRV